MIKKFYKKIIEKNLTFIVIFVISILLFIPFIKVHYATDTYFIMNKGYLNYAVNNSFKDGRIIMALISEIAQICNLPINAYISILTILAIFVSCISVNILKNIFLEKIEDAQKNKYQKILITIFSYFTIFNFMFIENMYFVECFVMSLSVLFYMLAAKTFVEKQKNHILSTLILLVLGLICYQGTFSMYLISLTVFLLVKNIKLKEKIKELIIGVIIGAVSIGIQFLIIKLVGDLLNVKQARVSGFKEIITNIGTTMFNSFIIVASTGFVFPQYLYIGFIVIISVISIINTQNKDLFCEQIIIILFSIIFALSISSISMFGFWSARIRYAIGTTIGFLYLHMATKMNLLDLKNKLNKLLILIFIFYGLITSINYIGIMENSRKVNIKDKEKAIEICNYVKEYEKQNNTKITKLILVPGIAESKAYYSELKYKNSVLSWSAIRTSWSIEELIEENLEIDLMQTNITNEQQQYYINNVDKNNEYLCINDNLIVSYYIN